jgi:protein-S-isoprenylcysteine O-methyltransferase Ste14
LFKTIRADWLFIVPASLVWVTALFMTGWDFMQMQGAAYDFGLVNLIGVILIVLGVIIRRRVREALGRCFSYGLRTSEGHELVTSGIYGHIRHPAYAGNLLIWSGLPLVFSSLLGFLVMLLLVPPFLYRMRIEENMLLKRFGNRYLEYMKRSKRLIPRIY